MPADNGSPQKGLVDDLVPSQWMDQMRVEFTDVPERRLMIALLFDVIRVLHAGGTKERAEVSAWIRGTNCARIPFNLLCDALELDPTCLARRLLRGTVAKVSRFRARAERRRPLPTTAANERGAGDGADRPDAPAEEESRADTSETLAIG